MNILAWIEFAVISWWEIGLDDLTSNFFLCVFVNTTLANNEYL